MRNFCYCRPPAGPSPSASSPSATGRCSCARATAAPEASIEPQRPDVADLLACRLPCPASCCSRSRQPEGIHRWDSRQGLSLLLKAPIEIGRASCRERGEEWVGGGS